MTTSERQDVILDECARLQTALELRRAGDLQTSHLTEVTENSQLVRLIQTWQRDAYPCWLGSLKSICALVVDEPGCGEDPQRNDGTAEPDRDWEAARLFVTDVIRDAYGPYVRDALFTSNVGHAGELLDLLESVGGLAGRYIADPQRLQSKGMNKLANTSWTALYEAFSGQPPEKRDRNLGVRAMNSLVSIIGVCLETMRGETSQSSNDGVFGGAADEVIPGAQTAQTASKALKFLASNFGRLLILMGEEHGRRTESWQVVREPVFRLWGCLAEHASRVSGPLVETCAMDPFDGIGLSYKALARSFEQAVGDPVPWWNSASGTAVIEPGKVRVLSNVLIRGSERMPEGAMEMMAVAVRSLVGSLATRSVAMSIFGEGRDHDGFVDDVEAGILEFMSRCVDASPKIFKRTLYFLMEYLLQPHPLVEEVLCRVVMGLMEWGWESLQIDCLTMICDILDRAVSCDEDVGLSPGLQQGVNVLAAAMLSSGEAVTARVAEARLGSSPTSAPGPARSRNESVDISDTVDVYDAVRLAVYLRALACCIRSFPSRTLGSGLEETLRLQLERIAKVHAKRVRGDDRSSDVELLLAWTAECLFHASKIVASMKGPLSERQLTNGATSIADVLMSAVERLSGRVMLSASPGSALLQRAAVLLDGSIRKICWSTSSKRISVEGLDAALDAFDASLTSAGWLVGVAPTRAQVRWNRAGACGPRVSILRSLHLFADPTALALIHPHSHSHVVLLIQRPMSRMRRVYGSALDIDASLPLQFLAIFSYKEYVSFSDSEDGYGMENGCDQALDVLPKSRIEGGEMSAGFKARLTPYLAGLEYVKYVDNEGNGSDAYDVGKRLSAMAKSLEDAFEHQGSLAAVSKRTHRQVVASQAHMGLLEKLRSAHQALSEAIEQAGVVEGPEKVEVRRLVSQMQVDLNSFLRL